MQHTFIEILRRALDEELARDPAVHLLGEDVAAGGAFGVTEGLQAKFGVDRVVDMPISEACIVGSAVGMALNGKTVMAEMQFMDFISCGFDQIFNINGQMAGGMMKKMDQEPMAHWLYYITVDAIDAAQERVKSAGGQVIHGPVQVPGGSWIINGIDPQGAMFSLVAPKR